MKAKYKFYATLLDSFQRYIDSAETWEKYFTEKYTFDEYEQMAKKEFIDKINRVPFTSEAADKGTAFNQLIDCLINGVLSENIKEVEINYTIKYNDFEFTFNKELCDTIADYFSGAVSQYFTESILNTTLGAVNLYGYIDELTPFKTVDVKTTASYSAFKFRKNWQHKVYPFCLINEGVNCREFEYFVVEFAKETKIHKEIYLFKDEYINDLIDICEKLILFIEENKSLITDKKIFSEL